MIAEPAGRPPVIRYRRAGTARELPIPEPFTRGSGWEGGKVKHCAVAVWQGMHGADEEKAAGADYLKSLAEAQELAGASYLDVNVDEFSADGEEKIRAVRWTAAVIQGASTLPLSIDSSDPAVLRAGLEACDPVRGQPMINSVSLERQGAIALAAEFKAVVIASAAGEEALPADVEGRLANIERLVPLLRAAGLHDADLFLDPLVMPISTSSANGKLVIDAVRGLRGRWGPGVHVAGGFSNVSFGMPARRLINQVFTWLCVEAGADAGIVDPAQINAGILAGLDTASEGFALARALLEGADEYGMSFIEAAREGRI